MHTSREILDLPELPGHITFVGAGIISMEFASLLTQFGVKATVIEFADRALLQYSAEYAQRVVDKLKTFDVDFHFGESVSSIEQNGEKYLVKTGSGLLLVIHFAVTKCEYTGKELTKGTPFIPLLNNYDFFSASYSSSIVYLVSGNVSPSWFLLRWSPWHIQVMKCYQPVLHIRTGSHFLR
nr:FAD-dependent oxidoreductase [uncultured Butyrivibrio sp.]